MFKIGRICVKIAGRDAGKKCIVVDELDQRYVLIDGETRRKKCNIKHLEPTATIIEIEKNLSHDSIKAKFKKLGIEIQDAKSREKKERITKQKKKKVQPEEIEAKSEKKKKPAKSTKKKEEKNKTP